jgi:hypothetical protein
MVIADTVTPAELLGAAELAVALAKSTAVARVRIFVNRMSYSIKCRGEKPDNCHAHRAIAEASAMTI